MSEEGDALFERRVELIRAIFDAGAWEELDKAMEAAHPDLVVDWTRSRGPAQGIYKGPEGARDFFAFAIDVFDELQYFHDEFIAVSDTKVIRVGGMRAKGHGSGVEVSARGANVFEFDGDLLTRVTLYQDREEALAAVSDPAARSG